MAEYASGQGLPRPPPYAWDWLQRSRPVVQALAQRLTGSAPTPAFLDELRGAYNDDRFVHAVVVDTVAEVAFGGRIPSRRPPGTTWDRGLSWWAAMLGGQTRREFEDAGEPVGQQSSLFTTPGTRGADPADAAAGTQPHGHLLTRAKTRPSAVATLERRRIAYALRGLIAAAGASDISTDAVRQLIHDLESLE